MEPELGASHNRGHKFPFIVSDILCTDNLSLLDTFFADEEEEEEHEEEAEAEGEGDFHKEDSLKDSESFKVEHVGEDDNVGQGEHQEAVGQPEEPQPVEGDKEVHSSDVGDREGDVDDAQVVAEGEQQQEPKELDLAGDSEKQPVQENVESTNETQNLEEGKNEDKAASKLEEDKVDQTAINHGNETQNSEATVSTDQDNDVSAPDSNVQNVENTQEEKAQFEESKINPSEEGEAQTPQASEAEITEENKQSESENTNEATIEVAENSNENGQDAQTQEKPATSIDTEEQINEETSIKESNDKLNQENHDGKEVENEEVSIKDDNEEKENKPVSDAKSKENNTVQHKEDQTPQNKSKVLSSQNDGVV